MNWNRDALIQELPEFDWTLPDAAPGPQLQAYSQHYGLNFEETTQALSHQAGLTDLGGYRLAVQRWMCPNARGTAIIVHGYYDHLGLYGSLIDFCLREQLNVVAFDLPGHGLSSGEQASISSFQEYDAVLAALTEQVQANMSGPFVAFGQSTGGAILINYLLTRSLNKATSPFADVVLLAPLVRPVGWRKGLWMQPVVRLFTKRMKRHHGDSSSDLDFLDFVRTQDPLQSLTLSVRWVGALMQWMRWIEQHAPVSAPVFVVQGDQDGTVDWRYNMKVIAEKFLERQLFVLDDGRHHLVNESLDKRADMYAAIGERLKQTLTAD